MKMGVGTYDNYDVRFDGPFQEQKWYLEKLRDLCRANLKISRVSIRDYDKTKLASQEAFLHFFFEGKTYMLALAGKEASSKVFHGRHFLVNIDVWKGINKTPDGLLSWIRELISRIENGITGFSDSFPVLLEKTLEEILKESDFFKSNDIYTYCMNLQKSGGKRSHTEVLGLLMVYLVYSYRCLPLGREASGKEVSLKALKDFEDAMSKESRFYLERQKIHQTVEVAQQYKKEVFQKYKYFYSWDTIEGLMARTVTVMDGSVWSNQLYDGNSYPLNSIIQAVATEPVHFLLYGVNGSGKSSALFSLWNSLLENNIFSLLIPLDDVCKSKTRDLRIYIEEKYLRRIREIAGWSEFIRWLPDGVRPMLLLDGYDKLMIDEQKSMKEEILSIFDEAAIMIVSRYSFIEELPPEHLIKLRLDPLSGGQIRDYLNEKGLKYPARDTTLRNLLSNALLLILYAAAEGVTGRQPNFKLVKMKKARSSSAIIWNYLEYQILRCYESLVSQDSAHVPRTIVAVEFILPYIACKMGGRYSISRNEWKEYIQEAFQFFQDNREGGAFDIIRERLDDVWELSEYTQMDFIKNKDEIRKILVKELQLVIHQNEEYCLFHPEFQDCLAAVSLMQQAEISLRDKSSTLLPPAWSYEPFSFGVFEHLEFFMDISVLENLWQRAALPGDSPVAAQNILELIKRKKKNMLYDLNFEGKDLSGIALRDCTLTSSHTAASFEGAAVSNLTFLPQGHNGKVRSVSFHPKMKFVATASDDNNIILWNPRTGVREDVLHGHESVVRRIAFSPDGCFLVSCSSDKTIRLWNMQNHRCRVLSGPDSRIRSIAYSPDNRHIACGSDNGCLYIWDTKNLEKEPMSFQTGTEPHKITSLSYSPGGKAILVGDNRGGLCLWSLENDHRIWPQDETAMHKKWINSTAFSPDGRYFVSASDDERLKVWEYKNDEVTLLKTIDTPGCWISSISFHPGGSEFVTGSSCGRIRIWGEKEASTEGTTKDAADFLSETEGWVESVCYSSDGNYIVSGTIDGNAKIWNTVDNSCLHLLEGNDAGVSSVAYGGDGNFILCGSYNGYISVWDVKQEKRIEHLGCQPSGICSIALCPDQIHVAAGGFDGAIYIWNWTNREASPQVKTASSKQIKGLSYSHDGSAIVFCTSDATILYWDLKTDKVNPIVEESAYRTRSICCSGDGTKVISGASDGRIRIWNIENPDRTEKLDDFAATTEGIRSVCCIGDTLYFASDNGYIYQWTITLQEHIWNDIITSNNQWVNCISVSPDGNFIASDSKSGNTVVWNNIKKSYEHEFYSYPVVKIKGCNFKNVKFEDERLKEIIRVNGGNLAGS